MYDEISYLLDHGLTETTESDQTCFDEFFAQAVPFTAHWEDRDDGIKIMEWDCEWEKFIRHRAELIDYDGRESYLPWNLYESLKLNWLDGYNYTQLLGDCGGNSAKNSLKASNLTNARRTGKNPKEIALSVAYGIARGNGVMKHGSGCNLNLLSKWTATVGNYWTEDFGKYDGGKYISKYKKGSQQDINALKTQSIIIYLPELTFDRCFAVCAAGFGISIGSSVYPVGSVPNGDGIAVASTWKAGKHATALIAAYKGKSGKRYVYVENSHYPNYAADSFCIRKQWGRKK